MRNEQIINAITVLRDVLKTARLSYQQADEMIKELKESPVVEEVEIERAFCAGFVANLHSMADFDGDKILKKYESYKNSGFFTIKKVGDS